VNAKKHIYTDVDKAVKEAFLTALDSCQMGWRGLAPYKMNDWAGNPALKHLLEQAGPGDQTVVSQPHMRTHRQCLVFSEDEWDLLGQVPNLNRDKMTYCFEHLPNHLKHKIDKAVLQQFEKKNTDE
jgi:hypothetical protein